MHLKAIGLSAWRVLTFGGHSKDGQGALVVWYVHKLLILFQAKNLAPAAGAAGAASRSNCDSRLSRSQVTQLQAVYWHFMSAAAPPTCSNYINCIDNLRLCCNFVHQLWLAINFDLAHINVGQQSCCPALRSIAASV